MAAAGTSWICCQLGAREHYAVPRALHRERRLTQLLTDVWVKPRSLWPRLPGTGAQRLAERFHPDLANADVVDFSKSYLFHELAWRLQRRSGWELMIARNQWFQARAVEALRTGEDASGNRTFLFAHSYSAAGIFQEAKARGWTTVLGQIDPGEEHFRLIQTMAGEQPEYGGAPPPPPASYLEQWRHECAVADWIVVNSDWSRVALERAGIPARKLRVIPLPYEPEAAGPAVARQYPQVFTVERPVRVLFVGSASVAKGVPDLLEAIDLLAGVPVELSLVGESAMTVPERFRTHRAIRWLGPARRSDVMEHYRTSDVLVFPSRSDGFGMAQVEAQAWALPVIASPFCGTVVRDGVTGIRLPEVSAVSIAAALRSIADHPDLLVRFSRNARVNAPPGLPALAAALLALESA